MLCFDRYFTMKCALASLWIWCLVLVTTINCNDHLKNTGAFGEAFNIQAIELDGVVSGGKSIFTSLKPDCFLTEGLKETKKNYKVYTDHEEFVHEIALSVGLSAKELGGKGDVSTKYLNSNKVETSGTIVEVIYLREKQAISDECLEESLLDPNLKHDLNKLPYPISKPHIRAKWLPYDAFIHKWGSHILKSTESGAKAIFHTTKSTKSTTNKMELKAKLCGKFPELNLDGCVDTGPKKSTTKESSDETNDIFVLGGSVKTQDMLRAGQFTPEVLDKLASEAADNMAPIKHEWFSLPELLLNRAMFDSDAAEGELQKATALVAYYKGYHVFGCDNQVVNKQNVTVFINEGDDDTPVYKCMQMRSGCMSDSDCVNWPMKYMGPCYCAGKTCMAVRKEGSKRGKATELVERLTPVGGFGDTINTHCTWSSQGGCTCDIGELEEVWPLGSILLRSTSQKKPRNWLLIAGIGLLILFLVIGVFVWYSRSRKTKVKSETITNPKKIE